MKRLILIMSALILFGCASSTLIRTIPDGAKVKQGSVVVGVTPYDYWDRRLSFTDKTFTLQLDGYKDKEVTITKNIFYVSRIFFPPVLAWPWMFGYPDLYYFELEKNSAGSGCPGLSLYQCWKKQLTEMPSHKARVEDVSMLLGVPPTRCETVVSPKAVMKAEQCYWELQSGRVAGSSGGGIVNQYGGAAISGSAEAHQRFFRASCRIHDGYLVECNSNWQE